MYETVTIQMRNLKQEPIEFIKAGVQYTGGFIVITNYNNNGVASKDSLFKANDVKTISYGRNI